MRPVMDVELMVRAGEELHPFRVRGICATVFRGRRSSACGGHCSAPGYVMSGLRPEERCGGPFGRRGEGA